MNKVVIGAGKTSYEGWVLTQEDDLNLLDIQDYYKLFEKKNLWMFF